MLISKNFYPFPRISSLWNEINRAVLSNLGIDFTLTYGCTHIEDGFLIYFNILNTLPKLINFESVPPLNLINRQLSQKTDSNRLDWKVANEIPLWKVYRNNPLNIGSPISRSYKILTLRLSDYEISNDATLIFQNSLVSKLFTNIFYNLKNKYAYFRYLS